MKRLLALGLLLISLDTLAQVRYPYFAPGGALSCTGNCSQQTVALNAGSSFITGTLPLANILTCSTTQIVFDSSGTLVCSSALSWNDSTHTLQLGSVATPATIRAPDGSSSAGANLSVLAGAGNGTNQAGGNLTFTAGNGTTVGGISDGTLNFNGGSGSTLTFNFTGGTGGDTNTLTFGSGDWLQQCNFASADAADCLFSVSNINSNASDWTHITFEAAGGLLNWDLAVIPSTATLVGSQCSVAAKPVICLLLSGSSASYAEEVNGTELILNQGELDLLMNSGTKFFKGVSSGTTIATTVGDSAHAGSVTNVIGGSSANTQANGVPILTGYTGTSGSIGGGALVAGACSSGTLTVTGAATTMSVIATPNTYPGDGNVWSGQVTSANTVTVRVCAIVAATPTASTYNVRVIN